MKHVPRLAYNKIVFAMAVIGMAGSVVGIFGGILLQSIPFMVTGLLIWGLCLVAIVSMALYEIIRF